MIVKNLLAVSGLNIRTILARIKLFRYKASSILTPEINRELDHIKGINKLFNILPKESEILESNNALIHNKIIDLKTIFLKDLNKQDYLQLYTLHYLNFALTNKIIPQNLIDEILDSKISTQPFIESMQLFNIVIDDRLSSKIDYRKVLKKYNSLYKNIEYHGFDLFEGLTKKIHKIEASKFPETLDTIKQLLNDHAKIFLYKGFTNETLKKFSLNGVNIDFIFIDGGHAVKTIESDFDYSLKIAEKNAYIIFDDFYETGNIDITKFGSNKIFEKLQLGKNKPKLLPFSDSYETDEEEKVIKMFMIQNKQI